MSSPHRSSQNHSKTHNKMESLNQSAELVMNSLAKEEPKQDHYTTRNSEDQKESIVKIKDESVFANPSEKARALEGRDSKQPFEAVKFNMTMQTFNTTGHKEFGQGFDALSPRMMTSHYTTGSGLVSKGEQRLIKGHVLTTKSGKGGFFSPQEAPGKAKALSCGRFGNLGSFETWRETRKSEGIIDTKESHRNYLINKNNGYKVDACFNSGKVQADIVKVPASTSDADTGKVFHDVTFKNIRTP